MRRNGPLTRAGRAGDHDAHPRRGRGEEKEACEWRTPKAARRVSTGSGLLILIAVVALNVIVYQQAMEIRSQLTTLNSVAYEVKQRVIGLQVQMDNDSKKGR